MTIALARIGLFGVLLAITGCASLSTEPPQSFDLTGKWRLNAALSDSPSLAALGRSGARQAGAGRGGKPGGGPPGSSRRGGQSGGPGSSQGGGSQGSIQVPVLVATSLSIEQNPESMGIEYDGANYRDVSWGERKRGMLTIEAGWKKQDLVIRTKGTRFPIEEVYTLSADKSRLVVVVELDGGKDDMTFRRVFEKG